MIPTENETRVPVRCVQCGKLIVGGRPDRKFCCPDCKNRWHNRRKYPDKAREVKRVLRILDNNRSILLRMMKLGIFSLDRMSLLYLGFNQDYFTSMQKGRCKTRYSCLDIQYELTPTRIRNIALLGEGVSVEELPLGLKLSELSFEDP